MNTNLKLKLENHFDDFLKHHLVAIHYATITALSLSGLSHKYILFMVELHTHYIIICYKLLDRKPTVEDANELLNELYKIFPSANLTFVKGSPFTNQSFLNELENKGIKYYHFSRDETPQILSIVTVYLLRMIQINMNFNNNKIHPEYIDELISFWTDRIVSVTEDLADHSLIDHSTFKKTQLYRVHPNELSRTNFLEDSSKEIVHNLSYTKFRDWENHSVSVLSLINFNNKLLENIKDFNGPITEKNIMKFLKESLESHNSIHNLLIPNDLKFTNNHMQEFYAEMGIKTIILDESNPNYNDAYKKAKVTAQIANNYFKDYVSKVSSKEDLKELIRKLEIHWNTRVYSIIHDQVELATKVY
jgi:hypothetical protein